jgi:hypothetical protein
VDVQGVVNGNVEAADRIILRKNSKLVGDLKMASVVIEDGAYFKGSIHITALRRELHRAGRCRRAANFPQRRLSPGAHCGSFSREFEATLKDEVSGSVPRLRSPSLNQTFLFDLDGTLVDSRNSLT